MELEELEQYEREERSYARDQGAQAARAGVVETMKPVFADKPLGRRYALKRGGAPLSALLFLYPTTLVYLPPMAQAPLEDRLGLPLEYVIELQRRGCLQPIIGHSVDYAGLPHFDAIFEGRPPSVWARGDEVGHEYGDAARHWDTAREVLPLAAIRRVDWVRAKWMCHYPSMQPSALDERIDLEVCTNFVDLCIFGFEPLAREIGALPDPSLLVERLLQLNEVLTYPHLLGAGGTPSFGLARRDEVEAAQSGAFVGCRPTFVPPEAELLLAGLDLRVPAQVTPDVVVSFHRLELAEHLWAALEELENEVALTDGAEGADQVIDASLHAARLSREAAIQARHLAYETERTRTTRRVSRTVDLGTKVASVGALAAGAISLTGLAPLAALLAGASITGLAARTKLHDEAIPSLSTSRETFMT